jgi:hypothetical protein
MRNLERGKANGDWQGLWLSAILFGLRMLEVVGVHYSRCINLGVCRGINDVDDT